MKEELTKAECSDGVALLTLHRPDKRNALSRALRGEIVLCLEEMERDEAVSAVVLTGAGPAFCAGFDRSEFSEGGMAEVFAEANDYHRCVYRFPKPLIAAVNGAALGGGCDLAAMCDFRIAATAAIFGQPQVRFGAPALYPLMREVLPAGAAREMCLAGRSYSAEEARSLGLVNRLHPLDELLDAAREIASQLVALPEGMAVRAKRDFLDLQPRLFES